ncbi:hypothetical protein ACPV5G_00825 [Photobacterium damselae]
MSHNDKSLDTDFSMESWEGATKILKEKPSQRQQQSPQQEKKKKRKRIN